MQLEYIIDDLQNLTNEKITQKDIGDALGISKQAIANKKAEKYDFKEFEINKIKKYILNKYPVQNLSDIDYSEKITLDYYPDLDFSCGNGIVPFNGAKEQMTIPTNLIKGFRQERKYIIVNAKSDSMMPEIKPNDLLIIRMIDTEPIIDNHIYIFCYDEHLYCKYLSYNIGQIIVRSANTDYPVRFIEKDNINLFKLYGEVVGHFRYYGG